MSSLSDLIGASVEYDLATTVRHRKVLNALMVHFKGFKVLIEEASLYPPFIHTCADSYRRGSTESHSPLETHLESFWCKFLSTVCCAFPCWISALIPLSLNRQDCQSSFAREAALPLENPSSQLPCHYLNLEIAKHGEDLNITLQAEKNTDSYLFILSYSL